MVSKKQSKKTDVAERPTSNEPANAAYTERLTRLARALQHAAATQNLVEARMLEAQRALELAAEEVAASRKRREDAAAALRKFVESEGRS